MIYLWQLTAIQLNQKTLLTGTILRGKSRDAKHPTTVLGNFFHVIRSYFHMAYKNSEVVINYGQETLPVRTNNKGHFSAILQKPLEGNLKVSVANRNLEMPLGYPVLFKEANNNIEIISDVDDTVMLSHTASFFRRIYTILFLLPQKRQAIVFTHKLFRKFQQLNLRIIYLSKSESNLFGLITAVIRFKELPSGPLLLTPYLNFQQLLFSDKGKDYKLKYLRLLFDNMPDRRFILLGDDSQKDMEVYTQIASEYSNRIIKIYIRQTGFSRSAFQQKQWNNLEATGIDAVYFKDADPVENEISRLETLIQNIKT